MGAGVYGHIFKPQEEVEIIVNILQRVYPSKKIKVELDIDPHIEFLAARNDMLELFGNILDNAYK